MNQEVSNSFYKMRSKNTIAITTDKMTRRNSDEIIPPPYEINIDIKKELMPSARNSYGPKESSRIVKNLFMLGISFTLLFTAYMAMANLQSSINSQVIVLGLFVIRNITYSISHLILVQLLTTFQNKPNIQDGIGLYALAACYGAFLISSLFLPPLLLAKLKTKWTLLLSVSGYIVYLSAQFYPRFETLVPAAMFVGTCGALLWASQSVYLTLVIYISEFCTV